MSAPVDGADALVAQRAQHVFQDVVGEVHVGAAAQHQVAFQDAVDQRCIRAQLCAAAKDRTELFQRNQRGHQFHRRRGLHGAFGAVRQHDCVTAQHQHAQCIIGQLAGHHLARDRFGQRGLGRGKGDPRKQGKADKATKHAVIP
jgi:hypothetical protein